MKYSQIIRAIIYFITMINTILTMSGHNPLPFAESELYIYVSIAVMAVAFVYGVWKNFPTSSAGRTADRVLHAIKQGVIEAQDVIGLIENGAVGGYVSGKLFEGRNRVTQIFGGSHGGLDVVGDDNKDVHSVTDGTVYMISKWDGKTKTGTQSYGNLVIIVSEGKRFYYAHLASIGVVKGQTVRKGDVIGVMGNTGNSFGAHTHFEVRTGSTTTTRIDPSPFCGLRNAKGMYVAPEPEDTSEPILYNVIPNETLNIRGDGNVKSIITYKDGAAAGALLSIVEEKTSGSQTWGRLADGRGWICLAYCHRESEANPQVLYNVKVNVPRLNVRTGAGVGSSLTGIEVHGGEVYGILSEQKVGSQMWGELKSGAGWICLAYCLKV